MASLHPDQVPFPESAAISTDFLHIAVDIDVNSFRGKDSVPRGPPNRPEESPDQLFSQLSAEKAGGFLADELATPLLQSLYPNLWLVTKKNFSHIDPLHRQLIKGRQILASEDSKMHLVWSPNKIFIKPIPHCLFSYHFWLYFLSPGVCNDISQGLTKSRSSAIFNRALALGFLRSYSYLIQHRSDFTIAQERHLIPRDIVWPSWRIFITHFHFLSDSQVSTRYHFGQMRHSRLNHLVRFTLPQERSTFWFYEPPYWSTAPYMKSITTSLGFVLVTISLVLSSMQVSLAAFPGSLASASAYWRFSVMVQSAIALSWGLMVAIPLAFLVWQLWWGFRHRSGLE